MKKIILSGILMIFLSGCVGSSTEKAPKEKIVPIQDLSTAQQKESEISKVQAHQENMDFLKNKFADNSKLTDAQKEDLVNFLEGEYRAPVVLSEQRYHGKVVYFEQIVNNLNLTQEQKKAAIKARFKQDSKSQGGL
ncbi:MAG: hypothetical protein NT079_02000 [Candidatus Omnitrophica bacterium]|nr:hypothetical protein [Candidatus Omnitrophota bacterium]